MYLIKPIFITFYEYWLFLFIPIITVYCLGELVCYISCYFVLFNRFYYIYDKIDSLGGFYVKNIRNNLFIRFKRDSFRII